MSKANLKEWAQKASKARLPAPPNAVDEEEDETLEDADGTGDEEEDEGKPLPPKGVAAFIKRKRA